MANQPRYLNWANFEMHPRRGTGHFLVVGASGTGKTTIIDYLLESVLTPDAVRQGFLYDPKQEMVPLAYAVTRTTKAQLEAGQSPIKILNPFDKRCSSWDIAKDIVDPISARQLATILVPEASSGEGGAFFTNAVRDLLTGILLVLIECVPNQGAWTFRDAILGMLYRPYMEYLLSFDVRRNGMQFPVVSRLRASYLEGDARTVSNINASINSRLSIYEPIAAVWDQVERSRLPQRFSLTDWAKSTSKQTLILGNNEAGRAALDALNQALFKRATELILAREEQPTSAKDSGMQQAWFFLDEVREAGELDGLSRLMTKGRSKGACVVLGFQDIDGMRDVYGDQVANEICAQCNNIAVMRLNSPSTAEWASDLFGRRLSTSRTKSFGFADASQPMNMNTGTGEDERPYLYTKEFLYLDLPTNAGAVTGFIRGPHLQTQGKTDDDLISEMRFSMTNRASKGTVEVWNAGFMKRPPSDFYLEPWDEKDWTRLGFPTQFIDLLRVDSSKRAKNRVEEEKRSSFEQTEREYRLERMKRERERAKREVEKPEQSPLGNVLSAWRRRGTDK